MPPDNTHATLDAQSLQPCSNLALLRKAVDDAVLTPLLAAVPLPRGRQAGMPGRDALPRAPMLTAYLISRYPGSDLPQKLLTLCTCLAEHPDVARLCGFDGYLPDRTTFHPLFKALETRPDLVNAAFSAISYRLLRMPQESKNITAPPPKPRRSGKRDGNTYRESRRKAAQGLIPLLHRKLRSETDAVDFMIESRWPDGVRCPFCDSCRVTRKEPANWRCRSCGSRFSLTSNTFLHSSNVDMLPTLLAAYLTLQSPNGVDALFLSDCLQDDLGLRMDHSETLYLQHRVRAATYELPPRFAGPIQTDDTYIGTENGIKLTIIGGVDQATNRVWAEVVDGDVTQEIVNPFVYHLREDGAWVYSDQGGAYAAIPWPHLTVNHSLPEYARFDKYFRRYVTTNWIESFWAFIDRLILEHGRVSRKHLPLYLAEALWHHNHRGQSTWQQMQALVHNGSTRRVTEVDIKAGKAVPARLWVPETHAGKAELAECHFQLDLPAMREAAAHPHAETHILAAA